MSRLWCAAALLSGVAAAQPRPVDFNRDIRPILSDRCFNCHGPDASTRLAGLRLDTDAGASVAKTKLLARISAEKPALRMPPPASGKKPISTTEAALIRTWVEQGARWQSHWAFEAPKRPVLPGVKRRQWVRNPIDRFVLAKLESEGLTPSAEADRARLIRRVSLDLTGLPPTPAAVDEFLADTSANAYEKVADRLLASTSYGEHMATAWLDAARYADTHGYQVDPEKQMWAWRDWVIAAFNRNLPYDQFTIEQLAGDLLSVPRRDQLIATGFHRNHRVNTEAGSIAEEFHAENLVDRVSTTGAVWLGLTIGCARCHDHKYDPITARDFYSMFALFNNVPEIGTGGPRDPRGNLQPAMRLTEPNLDRVLAEADARVKSAQSALKEIDAKLAPGLEAWEESVHTHQPSWRTLKVAAASAEDARVKLEVQPDGSILSSGGQPDKTFYEVTVETGLPEITAFRFELIPDARMPAGGSGRGKNGKGVLTQFDVMMNGRKLDFARISADYASAESVLNLVLRPMQQLKRGWAVDPEFAKPHFVVIEPTRPIRGANQLSIRIGNEYGGGALVGRFRISATDSEFPEPVPEEISKILGIPAGGRTVKEERELRRYYLTHPREHRRAAERVANAEAVKRAVEAKIPTTMIMRELEEKRDSFVLIRGSYDKPGEKVQPGVPAALGALPDGAPKNRLGLARWIADPENPLTARVAVNRFWQGLFGTGLVKTSEDFGAQGERPSHPELLDWLATEFTAGGWDIKAMQKLIVMSATYRQSSKALPALIERDPENRLLTRGPRFRLGAEAIRDQALAVAGLLSARQGGPSVKPYQPDGLWEQLSVIDDRKLYERSKGEDLWRRSLYTFWKRTVPPPSLTTFDAPTREFCVIKRPMSSTPLQALALLNDETYTEASRKLAERMLTEAGPLPSRRLSHGFRLATARMPNPAELLTLQAGLERRLTHYRADRKAAEALLGAGESPRNPGLNVAELAAYATVASVILNLDEVVTKQ